MNKGDLGRRAGGAAAAVGGALLATLWAMPAAAVEPIPAGAEYTLSADVILAGGDNFIAGAASGGRCRIHGGGHNIHTADATWTGAITIQNCDIDGLGTEGGTAIETTGGAAVTIQGTLFSTSGEIFLILGTATGVIFQRNTIDETSLVRIVNDSLDNSQDVFHVRGGSTGARLFQGNVIRKSRLHFEFTGDWMIGGDTPADGNILAGPRTGIFVDRCGAMTIRGNYSSTQGLGWNQVKNLAVQSSDGGALLIEHNVFIGMGWNTEVFGQGEIRYNLFANPTDRAWVQVRSKSGIKVHHNLLVQTDDSQAKGIDGGFVVLDESNPPVAGRPDVEIYNNTLDAGGACNPGLGGGALSIGALLDSLRSNALVNTRLAREAGIALVGNGATELSSPLPAYLGYTDYNLFHNPDASVKANYGVGVAGKTLRADPGFGAHDVPAGGAPNAQIDPKFAGPIPHAFPFAEADAISRSVDVCQILAFYRTAYTPGAGSPLIDAGDPQEGAGNDIGAVGAGVANDLDKFGRFCDPATVTALSPAAKIYSCPTIPLEGGGGGDDPVPPGPHGFMCVCSAGERGAPDPFGLGAIGLAALAALRARRRARR